jgi:PadR family transcriptional regulator PadR
MDWEKEIEQRKRQIRKGVLAYAVLLSINKQQSYALNILDDLKVANMLIVEGTLYPLLSRFKREELLDYEWKESVSWPPRKYYTLTQKGKITLDALWETWWEIVGAITFLTKKTWKKL